MKLNHKTILAFVAGFAAALLVMGQPVWAQKGPSDKLVKHIADSAFNALPNVVKDEAGKDVVIDKSKASTILVPNDQLREVILVGTQVSKAASCKLDELATIYWVVYRKSLKKSGKWTDQQRAFMGKVFADVVGIASATEAKATIDGKEKDLKTFKKKECSDKTRTSLKSQIEKNIDLLRKS